MGPKKSSKKVTKATTSNVPINTPTTLSSPFPPHQQANFRNDSIPHQQANFRNDSIPHQQVNFRNDSLPHQQAYFRNDSLPHQAPNFRNDSLLHLLSQSNIGESHQNSSYFSQPSQNNTNFSSPPPSQSLFPTHQDDSNNSFPHYNPSAYGQDIYNPPPHFVRQNHDSSYGFAPPPPPSQPQTVAEPELNKHVFWQIEDDIILARAWVNVTDDAVVANEQLARVYWARVLKMFNEHVLLAGRCERGLSSLKNRMNRMRGEVTKYMEAKDMIENEYHSGWNETMLADAIMANFAQRAGGKSFKFAHVLDILMSASKYNFRTSRHEHGFVEPVEDIQSTPPREDASQDGSTRGSGYSGSKRGSDEVTSPSKRPIGNKAAKRAAQASKGKGRRLENEFASAEFKETRKKYLDRKMELADMKVKMLAEEIEQRRLTQEAQREFQLEQHIVNMSADGLEGEEKEALKAKKASIFSKWFKK